MPIETLRFSDLDRLVADKTTPLDIVKERKVRQLQDKLDRMGVTGTIVSAPDADSFTVELPDGSIQIIRSGDGLDAPDSFWLGTDESQRKFQQQAQAYNRATGTRVDEVTPEHLRAWKDVVSERAAKSGFGKGDQITYIPRDEKSKLGGDIRTIADIYNQKNQLLSSLLDTPESNTAYSAPWNTDKRDAEAIRDYSLNQAIQRVTGVTKKSGYDAEGNAIAVQQPDGWYTYGDIDGLTAAQIDFVKTHEKSNRENWGEPGTLTNIAAGAAASVVDILDSNVGYVVLAVADNLENGEDIGNLSLTLEGRISDYNNSLQGIQNPITDEDLQTYMQTPEQAIFLQSSKMGLISNMEKEVLDNNKHLSNARSAAAKFRKKIYASNLDEDVKQGFDEKLEEEGFFGALGWMLTTEPTYAPSKIVESLPIMAAVMHPLGLATLYTDVQNQAIQDFTKYHGEAPTGSERNIITISAMIATGAERLGAQFFFGKIPGLKRYAASLLAKYPKAARVLLPFSKILGTAVAEGVSESITETGEQFAVKQDIDELDSNDIAFAGAIGSLGGGSLKTPGAAVDVVRSNDKKIRKEVVKLQAKLATPDYVPHTKARTEHIKGRLDKIDKELERYPHIGQNDRRDRLQAKREELSNELKQGTKNPQALSEKHRGKLQERLGILLEGLNPAQNTKVTKAEVEEGTVETSIQPNVSNIDRADQLINQEIDVNQLSDTDLIRLGKEIVEVRATLNEDTSPEAAERLEDIKGLFDNVRTRMTTLTESAESKDSQKIEEVVYSLGSISDSDPAEQNNVIDGILKSNTATPKEKKILKQRKKTNILREKVTQAAKKISQVHSDVMSGARSFKAYLKNFDDPSQRTTAAGQIKNLASIITRKLEAFEKASALSTESGGTKYINKKTLEIVDNISEGQENDFWYVTPTQVAGRVHPVVEYLRLESDFANHAVSLTESVTEAIDTREISPVQERNAVMGEILGQLDSVEANEPKGSIDALGNLEKKEPTETKQKEDSTVEDANKAIDKAKAAESEQTESVEDEASANEQKDTQEEKLLDSPITTKLGFKKRFTQHGLFENGRLISLEKFKQLDEKLIHAVAKSLEVCK